MATKSKPEATPAAAQQPEQPQELLSIDTLRDWKKNRWFEKIEG